MLTLLLATLLACNTDRVPFSDRRPISVEGPPPALVETAEVRTGGVDESWSTLGEVVALQQASLAAAVTGPVEQVRVREGDPVDKGDLLLEVDPALAAARAERAQASAEEAGHDLDQARRTWERLGKVDARVLAETDIEEAGSRLAALEARHHGLAAAAREAQVELSRHRLRAPFSGVITARHVDAGDWVSPGQPVLELVSSGAVEVRVDAAPELARSLEEGAPVELVRDSVFGDGHATGTVVRTLLTLDDVSRTALVRVAPDEPVPEWLQPGSTVQVRFQVRRTDGGLVVPRDALVEGAAVTRVFRVTEGDAEPVDVHVLARGADEAVVAGEGLAAGDAVVVRGNERLRPGQAVTETP